jgi:hypothetical protein
VETIPYLLGQIGLVGNGLVMELVKYKYSGPYLLGQIGLFGNVIETLRFGALTPAQPRQPYLLGQIGLVGKQKKGF